MSDLRQPCNLEAERSVLGALLVNPSLLSVVEDVVTPEDFYRDAHQTIYRHMLKLAAAGKTIDFLPLRDSLERSKELEAVNGAGYLTALTDGMPRSTNAGAYAQIVRDQAIRRQVMRAAAEMAQLASTGDLEAADVLERAQQVLWAIAVRQRQGELVTAASLVPSTVSALEDLATHRDGLIGISTGLADLDAMLLGLRKTDLIILAARPSMGKTAIGANFAAHAAHRGARVAFFSLEMSKEQLMFRFAAAEARVHLQRLMSGRTTESEYPRLSQAFAAIGEWPLHIDDSGSLTIGELRARCRRLHAKHGDLGLIVVDYLQLMHDATKKHDSRVLELATISRGLKQIAKELRVPIVALSQLSRKVEDRRPPRPMLSDIRESGALEQDADVVLLLWREEQYQPTPENQGQAEVVVAKQRNGMTGAVTLKWFGAETRFANATRN